jgi:hypothetical protein
VATCEKLSDCAKIVELGCFGQFLCKIKRDRNEGNRTKLEEEKERLLKLEAMDCTAL